MKGILLLSFGGPESADEVMPFLRRVTAGRGIPDERLAAVAEHYVDRGGRSPINDENRALLADLRAELDRRGRTDVPVVWGNRNAEPFVADALHEAVELGIDELVTVATSAYQSYSSCRQYREDLAAGVEQSGVELTVTKIGPYALSPGFLDANVDLTVAAVEPLLAAGERPHLLFVTHSIPDAMDLTSGSGDEEERTYSRTHVEVARTVLERVEAQTDALLDGEVVFCSRSGPPSQPWLEPDVNDRIAELADAGVHSVVVIPIGFVSDHMEVVHDLDTEAAQTAERVGTTMVRVPTVGRHPAFVAGLVDLVFGPPRVCPAGCCPNLRTSRPALCGLD